jgi:hypothetical protein
MLLKNNKRKILEEVSTELKFSELKNERPTVDTSHLKKGTSEVLPECQNLINKLKACDQSELIEELSKIETWTFGKCELFHWIDILDIFDEIVKEATQTHNVKLTM